MSTLCKIVLTTAAFVLLGNTLNEHHLPIVLPEMRTGCPCGETCVTPIRTPC